MKYEHYIEIDTNACIGCGLCQKDCPASNINMVNKKAGIISQQCIMCAHCLAICPKAAVTITGFDEQPAEIGAAAVLDSHALLQALRSRRSIRQFLDREIAPEVMEHIIEAGRLTPTGKNAQAVEYVVLQGGRQDAEKVAVRLFRRLFPLVRLVDATARRSVIDDDFFFKKAPVAIAVVAKSNIDGALAASNMALMAEAHGLGVLYSGYFAMAANASRTLRKMLGLTHGRKVVTTLVLGHPAVKYRRPAPKEPANLRVL